MDIRTIACNLFADASALDNCKFFSRSSVVELHDEKPAFARDLRPPCLNHIAPSCMLHASTLVREFALHPDCICGMCIVHVPCGCACFSVLEQGNHLTR